MKAFGVRLAAGAVTIVMGAVMAAQSQKEQQASTDSAWTEQQIPPGKTVSPIGSADAESPIGSADAVSLIGSADSLASDSLSLANPDEVKSLKPLESEELAESAKPLDDSDGVVLVQHTEAGPAMSFPGGESDLSGAATDASAGPSGLSMAMPDFDSAPPLELDSQASKTIPSGASPTAAASPSAGSSGPSFSADAIGATETQAAPSMGATGAQAGADAKMSGVTFAETSETGSADAGTASGQNVSADNPSFNPMRSSSALTADTPSNSLRAGTPAELAEMPPAPTFADSSDPAAVQATSDDSPKSGLAAGAAALSAAFIGSGVSASDEAGSDSPAKITGFTPPAGSETTPMTFAADSPAAETAGTANPMRSSMQINMGASPEFGGTVATASDPAPASQTTNLGISSQPRIVGDGSANPAATPFRQTGGQGGQGYASPAGGFETPAGNYPTSEATLAGNPQGMRMQPSADASQGVPRLPSPSIAGNGFDVPPGSGQMNAGQIVPGQASPTQSTPLASQPYPATGTPTNSFGAAAPGSIYQEAGFKKPRAAAPILVGPTMASPGERFLDGPQSPSIVIQKRAPTEVKVGKPASFVITVRNVGTAKALNVQVFDRVPTGMTLTDATPRPDPQHQPELFWDLGDMEPNQERTITLQMTPEQEGELGSVARVTFQAAASVRTISTRPELKVAQRAPEKVLIGQQLEIELEVSNPGTGEATGVILQEDVPAGLEHPQGKQLDNSIGRLGPGEIRRQILRMRAVKPGLVQNKIRVKGDDGLETTHTVAVEVIAPDLKVSLSGPSRRYLERQATYNLEIANVGTADATNVEISVQLDRGFTFVKTDYEGQYDPSRHAVFWSLPALPVGQSGKVPLTLLPVEEGQRVLLSEASADLGVRASNDTKVVVDSLAELTFSINDSADPIEVGGNTTYEIRIKNSGSRDDTNVKVALQLPPGLQLAEQGDFTSQGQGVVTFSPRAQLEANDEIVLHVKALGVAPGRHLVKAIVTSDQSDVPVTKEESIMVYSDQ